ncbi:PKD domain-containing protein [Haloarcula amylovorans]|uniref:PKD domain-containing protein n=1 Tax=Haloarcula amylovorans TaxID=2562280 RepID=UPI0010761144|nr:PKD domain-containing protein [Halomicroarcula amylolytica]
MRISNTTVRSIGVITVVVAVALWAVTPAVAIPQANGTIGIEQTADQQTVAPGDTVTIQTTINASGYNAPAVSADLPSGWSIQSQSAEGPASYKSLTNEWVWLQGGEYMLTYTVAVPDDASGEYTVTSEGTAVVPADDSFVSNEAATTITVAETPTNQPPTASVSGPDSLQVGEQATFEASASDDGSLASYEWNFGDDSTATGQSVSHAYSSPGDYTVQLTVTDDDGASTTATTTVSVSEAPDPATLQVTSLNAPSSATQGDTVTVEAVVENTGDMQGTQDVEFAFDGSVLDSKSVTLASGASDTISFTVDTTDVAPGTYTHTVSTADDSATAELTITDPASEPDPGTVDVSLEPAEQSAATDDEVTYEIVVTGTDEVGAVEGSVTLSNPDAATITGLTTSAADGNEDISVTGQSAEFTAFGLPADTSEPVTVGTVTVSADALGDTELLLSIDHVSDQQGNGYTVDSTTGATLSVSLEPVVGDNPPANMDDDEVLEDVNGNGEFNVVDAQALFYNQDSPVVQNNIAKFDFNGDGEINVGDAQAALYQATNAGE